MTRTDSRTRVPNASRRVKPINRPESRAQAREWDNTKLAYRRLGLCHRCAAQAAYGHQLGFVPVEPPCGSCLPVVLRFDLDAGGVWRKASKGLRRSAATRARHSLAVQLPMVTIGTTDRNEPAQSR